MNRKEPQPLSAFTEGKNPSVTKYAQNCKNPSISKGQEIITIPRPDPSPAPPLPPQAPPSPPSPTATPVAEKQ